MSMRAPRAVPLAAVLLCTLLSAPARAQTGSGDSPPDQPPLRRHPQHKLGGRATPTPTTAPTATATATPAPTATPKPDLPATGSDPGMVALAGMTLLGFGLSLRLRVALADARRDADRAL